LGWKQAKCDWTRPGIMLYGADPLMTVDTKLKPVMQLTSKIISIRNVKQGESIGYGSIFTAERDTVVGVVACGYADGYPRSAVTGTPMAVDGKMTRLIGRVSMDMLFVDLTDIPNATIGSQVELWGNQIAANAVATSAGTIAYELFCNVKRAHFQYFDAANI
ncbi:MAG: alanine racemase, partial [Pseudomonadota bacterium]